MVAIYTGIYLVILLAFFVETFSREANPQEEPAINGATGGPQQHNARRFFDVNPRV